MFIFLLFPNKKKRNLHSTRVYLYVYFFIIPKQEKKKALEPGRLEYYVNGTRVYQARLPQIFFNRTNPTQQCHGGKLMRNSSF